MNVPSSDPGRGLNAVVARPEPAASFRDRLVGLLERPSRQKRSGRLGSVEPTPSTRSAVPIVDGRVDGRVEELVGLGDRNPDAFWGPERSTSRLADKLRTATTRPGVILACVGVGSALLAVAATIGFLGWQSSPAETVDERLPFVTSDTASAANPQPSTTAEPAVSADGGMPASPSVPVDEAATVGTGPADRTGPAEPAGPVEMGAASTASVDGVGPDELVVHVSGAVAAPGVVVLDAPARLHHAVAAAGGATEGADLDRVNLAAPLADGTHLHIPREGAELPPPLVAPIVPRSTATESTADARWTTPGELQQEIPQLDLNRASISELDLLPGVGPATASAIVSLRDAQGPYLSVEELIDVDGIGPAKLDAIRPHVYVTGG